MKKLLLFATVAFTQYVCFAQPVIASFAPQAALPQSQVTITGSGFSTIADSNIVYFGAVRALVNASSVNQITVSVPVGASYSPINVTSGGLTGYSQLAFNPTTLISINEFDSSSFETPVVIPTLPSQPKYTVNTYDIDADGKIDILCTDSITTNLSIIRNASQKGKITSTSFAAEQRVNIRYAYNFATATADFNGDGKKDFAVAQSFGMNALTNTSTLNNPGFSLQSIYDDFVNNMCLGAGDLDGNGKPDLIAATKSCCIINNIIVLKNTTPLFGNTRFDSMPAFVNTQIPPYIDGIAVGDLNGDGKPEIIYTNRRSSINILKNISTPGNIAFSDPVYISAPDLEKIAVADLNNDGKIDIICSNTSNISIFKNTSTTDTFILTHQFDISAGRNILNFTIGDIDGDGLVDIGCAEYLPVDSYIGLFKNTSNTNDISFAARVEYKVDLAKGIGFGDIDGDGKQDIIVGCGYFEGNIAVLRNKIGESSVTYCTPSSVPDTIVFRNALIGTNYQWQVSTDSVNFSNITNTFNFIGINSANLVLIGNLHSWHGQQFRCMVNGKYDKIYTVSFKNTWTGAIDSTWENTGNWSCNALPDTLTDVVIPANSNVVLGSNGVCRSINISPSARLEVLPGFSLSVTH